MVEVRLDALSNVADAGERDLNSVLLALTVHDVGSTDECPCYVVSKYIQGIDLATRLKQRRLQYD